MRVPSFRTRDLALCGRPVRSDRGWSVLLCRRPTRARARPWGPGGSRDLPRRLVGWGDGSGVSPWSRSFVASTGSVGPIW